MWGRGMGHAMGGAGGGAERPPFSHAATASACRARRRLFSRTAAAAASLSKAAASVMARPKGAAPVRRNGLIPHTSRVGGPRAALVRAAGEESAAEASSAVAAAPPEAPPPLEATAAAALAEASAAGPAARHQGTVALEGKRPEFPATREVHSATAKCTTEKGVEGSSGAFPSSSSSAGTAANCLRTSPAASTCAREGAISVSMCESGPQELEAMSTARTPSLPLAASKGIWGFFLSGSPPPPPHSGHCSQGSWSALNCCSTS